MYNIPFAYTKKKRLLLTTLCGLFFRGPKKELFISRKEKNKKTKKRRILIPFWLGFSAKPHCIHRTLTQSLLYTNELPPPRLRYKRDGCAEEEKRWGCEKRKRERILKRGSDALLTWHTHEALSFPSRRSLPIWILFCRVGYFHFSLVEQEYVRTKTDKILRSLFPRNQVSSVKVL
jgi:hypothetical protein